MFSSPNNGSVDMKLEEVTLYSQGNAKVSFATEVELEGRQQQRVVFKNVPGKVLTSRLLVRFPDAAPGTCDVLESRFESTQVPAASSYETGSPEVRECYAVIKTLMKERSKAETLKRFHSQRSDTLNELMKNLTAPKTLAKQRAQFFPIKADGGKTDVASLTATLDKIGAVRAAADADRIEADRKLQLLNQELNAAQERMTRVLGRWINWPHSESSTKDVTKTLIQHVRLPSVACQTDICFTVSSTQPGKQRVIVEYLVYDCSWQPCYDFHLRGSRLQECQVKYSAKIHQATGLDWNAGIKLNLSTGDALASQEPNLSFSKQYVDFMPKQKTPQPPSAPLPEFPTLRTSTIMMAQEEIGDDDPDMGACWDGDAMDCESATRIATPERGVLGNLGVTIPKLATELKSRGSYETGNTEAFITISTFRLKGDLYHYLEASVGSGTSIQRSQVFRAVVVHNDSDWMIHKTEDQNDCSITVNGSIVGCSRMRSTVPKGSSFVLYAGVDEFVQVKNIGDSEVKSRCGNFVVGNSKKQVNKLQLQVKNTHKTNEGSPTDDEVVNLIASFTMPESRDSEIVVAPGEDMQKISRTVEAVDNVLAAHSNPISQGTVILNSTTGSVLHRETLLPGKTVLVGCSYSVSYPQDKEIEFDRSTPLVL